VTPPGRAVDLPAPASPVESRLFETHGFTELVNGGPVVIESDMERGGIRGALCYVAQRHVNRSGRGKDVITRVYGLAAAGVHGSDLTGVAEGPEGITQACSVLFEACPALLLIFGSQNLRSLAVLDTHEVSLFKQGEVRRPACLSSTRLLLSCCRDLRL
jgi:hypothetical protein